MSVDRANWAPTFRILPQWSCPTCSKGVLVTPDKEPKFKETGQSTRLYTKDEWDPDWVTTRFAGFTVCNNSHCGDVFSISGTSGVAYYTDEDVDGNLYQSVENEIVLKSVFPPLYMFEIPKECPSSVRDMIVSGFQIFWSDHEGCANKFRMAVELLLTDRKIPTYTKAKPGKKRSPLTLHARIDLFKVKNLDLGTCLEAVKWLGNHGSHSGKKAIGRSDVFDAAEMLEFVINEIYLKVSNPLKKANKINKKKGPA